MATSASCTDGRRLRGLQAFSGIDDFLRNVELHDENAIEVGEADVAGADAVRFMTVHAAKGLEFPVVFFAHVKPPRPNTAAGCSSTMTWA